MNNNNYNTQLSQNDRIMRQALEMSKNPGTPVANYSTSVEVKPAMNMMNPTQYNPQYYNQQNQSIQHNKYEEANEDDVEVELSEHEEEVVIVNPSGEVEPEEQINPPSPKPNQLPVKPKQIKKIPQEITNLQPQPIIKEIIKSPPTNYTTEYAIVPVILIIVFIFMIYPASAKYLEKYIPPLKDFKGYAIRALIFGTLYIALRFAVENMKK